MVSKNGPVADTSLLQAANTHTLSGGSDALPGTLTGVVEPDGSAGTAASSDAAVVA